MAQAPDTPRKSRVPFRLTFGVLWLVLEGYLAYIGGMLGATLGALWLAVIGLATLPWAAVRGLWHPTRLRRQRLRGLLSLFLGLAPVYVALHGLVAIFRLVPDQGQLPIADRYVVVIVADGASLVHAKKLLFAGLPSEEDYTSRLSESFPNISKYFLMEGAFTANGVSIWPSSSIPAHTGIMTGCYPRKTGVMGMRQFSPDLRQHTSYIGLGILAHRHRLDPQVKTLNEWFPEARSVNVLQIANRGTSLYVPSTPHDGIVVDRSRQVLNWLGFFDRFSKKEQLPRILVMVLPDIDHQTHNSKLDDEISIRLYKEADTRIGEVIDLYKQRGLFDKTLFVVCADHGMGEVRNHVTLDNLMQDLRFDTFQSLKWSVVPAWGSFEANVYVGTKYKFDHQYNSVALWGGNSDALLYLKGQQLDEAGNILRENWDLKPTDEQLHHYAVGGTVVDVIERLFTYSPGVGLIATNPAPDIFNVYSRDGQGQIRERTSGDIREFQYEVVKGIDPLGYATDPLIGPAVKRQEWHSDQQWLDLTYLAHYPDALRRLSACFGNPDSATMALVASDGWDFTPWYVAKRVLVGSHGSLNHQQSLVPIMFRGPGIKRVELPCARTVDILPTILAWLDVDPAGLDGRPLPIFEEESKVAEWDKEARTFLTSPVECAGHRYALQQPYASYDRRLVRLDSTGKVAEVLVADVRKAVPELQAKPYLTLELRGAKGNQLELAIAAEGEVQLRALPRPIVLFDPVTKQFGSVKPWQEEP